jgi:hypothetical protein
LLYESADLPLRASRLVSLEFDAEEGLFFFEEELDFFPSRKNPEDFFAGFLWFRRSSSLSDELDEVDLDE